MWLCECSCGTHVHVRGSTLVADRTKACHSCAATQRSTTHGQSRTPLYFRWRAMHERTGNPNHSHYKNYGGRGIAICERWMSSFEAFEEDMGPTFQPDFELDRIDVNGHYSPENCRWVSKRQQQRNKRSNHVVTWNGRSMVVTDWAEVLGLVPNTLIYRLRRGWPVERALTFGVEPARLLELASAKETVDV